MRKSLSTIILFLLAVLSATAAIFLARDGSLARLTGWYHFRPGMTLFPSENLNRLKYVDWMRIRDLHDTIECERDAKGAWWIVSPFRDRMSAEAAQYIIAFTAQARVVDTLPLNRTTRASLREFGVDTVPHTITLKVPTGNGERTTVARYTLGSASPWLADTENGEAVLPTSYLRTDYYGRDKRIHVVRGNILAIFKNGLQGLRDPHPLNMEEEAIRSITISRQGEADISLTRASAQSPWAIISPIFTEAEQDYVSSLIANLLRLKATRIDAAADIELPAEPTMRMQFSLEDGQERTLCIYAPFAAPSADGQRVCYATVDDRPVVLTLPWEPRLHRKGDYAELVNAILALPVLPSAVQARLQSANETTYLSDLRLSLSELRSPRLTNINPQDIDRVYISSRFYPYPVRLLLIPGEVKSKAPDIWMCSAAGHRFETADMELVTSFLKNLSSIPVAGFVADYPFGHDAQEGIRKYGLNNPDYVLLLRPRECSARAILFGVDLPLVKDRASRTFFFKRYHDTGETYWVAMEQGINSIFRLSPKMTSRFTFSQESWKNRQLMQFSISSLRTLTLNYQRAPLVLHYDYIGESWEGTLGDEDISLRINPYRTNYYLRHLQNIRVKQWLEPQDEEALTELASPAFSVKLDLESVVYSEQEGLIISQHDDTTAPRSASEVKPLLEGSSELDRAFENLVSDDRKVEKRTITLEISPSRVKSSKPFFYGRIRETGELFILSYDDAQSLGASLLD